MTPLQQKFGGATEFVVVRDTRFFIVGDTVTLNKDDGTFTPWFNSDRFAYARKSLSLQCIVAKNRMPKQGDTLRVRHEGAGWEERTFIAMYKNRAVCEDNMVDNHSYAWPIWETIPETYSITLDNLSECKLKAIKAIADS